MRVSEQSDKNLLTFIATTVETMRDQMVTKDELAKLALTVANMRVEMSSMRDEMSSMRDQMATKADLARLETKVNGDFEQVHLRFDNLERVVATRFGLVETEVSRLRSAVYLLAKDKPDILRLLGQPILGESRP